MAEKNKPSWSAVKRKLTPLDQTGLLGLVKDLYDASAENRAFLTSRFLADENGGAILEEYRQRIIVHFFPKRGFGDLNLREARKQITQYKRASGDAQGVIELMLTYVEAGTRFTNTYGDISEAFYNSLVSVLMEMTKQLKTPEGMTQYSHFEPRLSQLVRNAGEVGWGYGDDVSEEIEELEQYAAVYFAADEKSP